MPKPPITGQVIVREATSEKIKHRRLIAFFGIVAVEDDFELQDGHQYTVHGASTPHGMTLTVVGSTGQPLSVHKARTSGLRPDQLLTSPIWKV